MRAVVAALVLLLAGGLAGCSGSDEPGEAEIRDACREMVEHRLKSPGSAEWSDEVVSGSDPWEVRGVVDSDNAFGASMRSDFHCRDLSIGSDDQWHGEVRVTERA